jgi:hypothetical protein
MAVFSGGSDWVSRCWDLVPEPESAGLARVLVHSACADWEVDGEVREDALLVISELVSNVVDHRAHGASSASGWTARRCGSRCGLLPVPATAAAPDGPAGVAGSRVAGGIGGVDALGGDRVRRRQVGVGGAACSYRRRGTARWGVTWHQPDQLRGLGDLQDPEDLAAAPGQAERGPAGGGLMVGVETRPTE